MDDEVLAKFVAYCQAHKITFSLHRERSGNGFRINFSAEDDNDVAELLKFLKGDADDKRDGYTGAIHSIDQG